MKTKEDLIFAYFTLALGTVCIGLGIWGLGYGAKLLHHYFLAPTYQFTLTYFANYGRMTAVIVCGLSVLGLWASFYNKTVADMTKGFEKYCQRIEDKRAELEKSLAAEAAKSTHLIEKRNQAERELWDSKEKNRVLKTELDALWRELEQLTEPEKVAEREKKQEQDQATSELIEHIEATDWREMG